MTKRQKKETHANNERQWQVIKNHENDERHENVREILKNDEQLWNTMKMMKMHEPENGEPRWKIMTDTVKKCVI